MARKRAPSVFAVVGVLVTVQAIAIGTYWCVESERQPRGSSPFAVERITADDTATSIAIPLERQDGSGWTLGTARGRPVVLHFWATWCGPCRSELPTLIAQQGWLESRGIELVLASVDDDWTDVRAFFGEGPVPMPVSRTRDDSYKRLTTGTLPETLFVDARGSVHARARGARDWTSPAAIEFLRTLAPDPPRE